MLFLKMKKMGGANLFVIYTHEDNFIITNLVSSFIKVREQSVIFLS